MYIDVVPNRHSPAAVLLRESFREGKKVRKRTLANLSHLDAFRIEALRRALRGDFDQLSGGRPVCGPIFGVLYALNKIAETLGIPQVLGRHRLGHLALFLVLARVAHRGSRLSAVRWARRHAVAEVLGLKAFDEEDLYQALDDLARRQEKIEQRLYRRHLQRRGQAPALYLYDVTSSYLEGENNELAEFGYNRDGKRGKMQIVVGLLTDETGEPLAVRVFSGSTADPKTLAEAIEILKRRFGVGEVVFVGDGGMIRVTGQQALREARIRYITALSQPQIRKLLKRGTLQLGLFEEKICEVEGEGVRYILRKNEGEARKQWHRLEDKLAKLRDKIQVRNEKVSRSRRCQPEAGLRQFEEWVKRHKLARFVWLRLQDRRIQMELDEAARDDAMQLAGCYVIETDVAPELLNAQQIHAGYKGLALVEQDLRTLKTGLLQVRPVFVRKASRTRGHVLACMLALKLSREIQRRLAAAFGTTDEDPYAVTLEDALGELGQLCLLNYPLKEDLTLPLPPSPNASQSRILEALQVPFPRHDQHPPVARS
jgi:transposase